MSIRSKFAPMLVRLRRMKDYSQKDVAEKLEIPRTTYAAYEESKAEPPLENLNRILKLYNLTTLEELLSPANPLENKAT